jgi:hypothetical protein
MANFARINKNNIVDQVIVVDNCDIMDPFTGEENENIGIYLCNKIVPGNWKQTSFNGNFRARYASIGYSYDSELDAFIMPKPHSSWILNKETTEWEAPIPKPELTQEQKDSFYEYHWDEEIGSWTLVEPKFS